MSKAIRSRVTCWALVLLIMVLVGWIRLLPLSLPIADDRAERLARRQLHEPRSGQASGQGADTRAIARRLRAEMTYTGADGREHVYLGDYDSYLWLRHARNYLRTGTPCDAVVDGTCRDTHTNAPVGARTPYARSLHVAAIVGVHRLVMWVRPTYPLPSSAFLVPVIAGVLGVIPAFFIARGLAGMTAGVFAAVVTAIHPIVLIRTIGSDNDVWNVVLPLYMVWAAMGALGAATSRRAVLWAGLAGIMVGLQAWAWRGWLFAYVVLMAGLVSAALLHATRYAFRHRTLYVSRAPDLPRTVLVLVVVYLVAGVSVSLAEDAYFSIPVKTAGALIRAFGKPGPADHDATSAWPSTLASVSELLPLRSLQIARGMGGIGVFVASLLGLLLLLLPTNRWRWWHGAVLAISILVYGYGVAASESSRRMLLALMSAPLAVGLIMQWWGDEEPPAAQQGGALVVIIWFLAAAVMSVGGLRFLLLLAPPFGIACAVAIGRLEAWIGSLITVMPGWYRPVGVCVLGGVMGLVLLYPVHRGDAVARGYTPIMRDMWWDSLTHLRETAHPDAIVHTWWDYGHWVKYVAERRVSNDGTSLLTHIPHWLARALAAPTEVESVGVLRMLSCGSDATPLPEGTQGAYGKVRATGRDPIMAYGIVSDLVTLDQAAATTYLTQRGFAEAERADILRSTHCHPPESYLIINSALVTRRRTWMSLGLWDPRRNERMHGSRDGSSATEPRAVLFVSNWLPCRTARGAGDMVCDVQLTLGSGGAMLHTFSYRSSTPRDARLQVRESRGGASSDTTEGTPATVLFAGAERIERMNFASPTHPDLAVLVDMSGARILVGTPSFLQSTFVHLMYLDGRYARHYRKDDDRSGQAERVLTWRVEW